MSENMHKTESWKRMVARVEARVAAEGGSTGSNMAEKPYIPPEARERWKNLPQEEKDKIYAIIRG